MIAGAPSRILQPAVAEGFEWALPVDEGDFEVFRSFDGRSRVASWEPIRMRLITVDDKGLSLRRAELPWLGEHVLILRDQAIESVGAVLARYGELLPLECAEARLAVFNATQILDAIDEERSDLIRFGSGRLMKIVHPVFREGIEETGVFKWGMDPVGPIYFARSVAERISATGHSAGTDFVNV